MCVFWKTFRTKFCPVQSFWFKRSLESAWTPPSAVILSGLEKVKRRLLAQWGRWLITSGCKRGKRLPEKIESWVWAQKSQSSRPNNRLNKMKQHQQKFWAEFYLTFFVNKGKSLKSTGIGFHVACGLCGERVTKVPIHRREHRRLMQRVYASWAGQDQNTELSDYTSKFA